MNFSLVINVPNPFSFVWRPLKRTFDLEDFLDSIYSEVAQYDYPPEYPVTTVCGGIDRASAVGNDILGQIFAGVVAYMGNNSCYDMTMFATPNDWRWQVIDLFITPNNNI